MTTTISPPRTTTAGHRLPHRTAAAATPLPRSNGPCCSLKARPQPQPQPSPTWDELLGRR